MARSMPWLSQAAGGRFKISWDPSLGRHRIGLELGGGIRLERIGLGCVAAGHCIGATDAVVIIGVEDIVRALRGSEIMSGVVQFTAGLVLDATAARAGDGIVMAESGGGAACHEVHADQVAVEGISLEIQLAHAVDVDARG